MENDNSARHEPQARIHTKAADDTRAAALNHNKRPGVSDATLLENGIEFTAPAAGGCTGFQIPFYTFEASSKGRVPVFDEAFPEKQFCRQRLAIPRGNQKYSQPSGTRSHVYFPLGLADLIRRLGYLIIVEGEAKAVALVEAGYPAIGITGIDSFQKQGALLPELVELLEWMLHENIQLTAIFFLGDADTCMNAAFSTAAIRLRDLLSGRFEVPLKLPRMPVADLERAKGIDDLREQLGAAAFGPFMEGLLADAVEVTADLDGADLAILLFEREVEAIKNLIVAATPERKSWFLRRLAGLANHVAAHHADELATLAKETGLVKKLSHFKDERKRLKEKFNAEMRAKRPTDMPRMLYIPCGNTKYFYETKSGEYTRVDRAGALNHLATVGYSKTSPYPGALSDADTFLTAIEAKPFDWAGAVAGHAAGPWVTNGQRVLITRGPNLIEPCPGDWDTINAFLELKVNSREEVPGSDQTAAEDQFPFILGWLCCGCRCLYLGGGEFFPNQCLILCGPVSAGKNVMQDIITAVLGQRVVDPFAFLEGSTSFNGELIAAEHWAVADQQSSTRFNDKQRLKATIKQCAVNSTIRINAKFAQPINVESFRRLTISLNDEPQALQVLPSLSVDFEDKLMILHVRSGAFFGAGTPFSDFYEWWQQVKTELPAFVNYLLHEHQIKPEHADSRYGILSFKAPEILRRLREQSDESRLLEIIDSALFPVAIVGWEGTGSPWQGTASNLFDQLIPAWRPTLAAFHCSSPTQVGHLLAHLVSDYPDRFSRRGLHGRSMYQIMPPAPLSPPLESPTDQIPSTARGSNPRGGEVD